MNTQNKKFGDLHYIKKRQENILNAQAFIGKTLAYTAVIVILIATTFGINLPLPIGVVGHEGSTVLVVMNEARSLAYK